jgi:WD40 repeat protein
VSSGGTVQLLEAAGGAPIGPPISHNEDNEGGVAFALSPDGTRFVTAPLYGITRLSNLAGDNRRPALLRPGDGVVSASFSWDGTRIVTASRDGTARLWDAVSGAPIGRTDLGAWI